MAMPTLSLDNTRRKDIMTTSTTTPRRTTPREVYIVPLTPTPVLHWMWTWTLVADNGDKATVKGHGMPSTGAEVNKINRSWTMHDDRAEAVLELRERLRASIAAKPSGDWSDIDPEWDPRPSVQAVPDDAA